MIQARDNPETRTCAPVKAWMEASRLQVRQCVRYVLDGQTYEVDLLGKGITSSSEWLVAVEAKESLTDYVIEQSERLRGLVNFRHIAVPEPESQSGPHQRRRAHIEELGIGLLYVNALGAKQAQPPKWDANVNLDLMMMAWAAHDGTFDPAAGSAGARAMTAERCLLAKIHDWLYTNGPTEFAPLKREFPTLTTSHKLRGLISANLDLKVRHSGQRTVYFVEES